jgi:hypothetical protein
MCAAHSRNSENNTGKFPDIVASLPGLLREGTESVVLDCEAVGFERATGRILPFQVVIRPPCDSSPSCMMVNTARCMGHAACKGPSQIGAAGLA